MQLSVVKLEQEPTKFNSPESASIKPPIITITMFTGEICLYMLIKSVAPHTVWVHYAISITLTRVVRLFLADLTNGH